MEFQLVLSECKVFLIEVEPECKRIRSPVSKGVIRILWKHRIGKYTDYVRVLKKAGLLLATIERRPLSYQAAVLDGDAAVKAYIASLLREIENDQS